MAARAKAKGFLIAVIFVGTDSVEINMERVRVRVAKGGHDVPEEDQRRRYPRTLANMKKLLPLADFVVILDNSSPRDIHSLRQGGMESCLGMSQHLHGLSIFVRHKHGKVSPRSFHALRLENCSTEYKGSCAALRPTFADCA